jgi:hypothetical protein
MPNKRMGTNTYLEVVTEELSNGKPGIGGDIIPGSPEHVRCLAECFLLILPDMGFDPRADRVYALAKEEARESGVLEAVAQMVTIGLTETRATA